jgi:acyl carrier protein
VPVRELGLDSVGGSQLRVELERRFGIVLPATLVFDHPTAEALADRVLAELTASSAEPPR